MPVIVSTLFLVLVLSLLVMGVVALPQLLAGKTVFSQASLDQIDARRRRTAARNHGAGVDFGPDMPERKQRLRAPIGWTESSPGPRHAR